MLVIERHKASKVLRRFESIGAGVVIGDLSCVIEMSPQAQAALATHHLLFYARAGALMGRSSG